ncbi:MAG TPA: hypothetical protein VF625_02080 [Longimicrobium sp.]
MRKLKLSIETLAVDSFETSRLAADAHGTVHAHIVSGKPYTCDNLCQASYLCPSHHQTECCGG